MPVDSGLLTSLMNLPPGDAWTTIIHHVYTLFTEQLPAGSVQATIAQRDRNVSPLDLLLSSSCWDLWCSFDTSVPKTSQAVIDFWQQTNSGKAVLILDALSVREMPYILGQAQTRGYTIHEASIRASELPADTNAFAKSLGFAQRSALESNSAGGAHKLTGAFTECTNLPWKECLGMLGHQPAIVFWHRWLDDRLHDLAAPGKGLHSLAKEAYEAFSSDDFWLLIESLTQGRSLLITSDHGYAATGLFPDVEAAQAEKLKSVFKGSRFTDSDESFCEWMPPIALALDTRHGKYQYVVGRKKWKTPGGYPTLAHGGLSLLEVTTPVIHISRAQ